MYVCGAQSTVKDVTYTFEEGTFKVTQAPFLLARVTPNKPALTLKIGTYDCKTTKHVIDLNFDQVNSVHHHELVQPSKSKASKP